MVSRKTSSRHSRCALRIFKSVEGLREIQEELRQEGSHENVVERLESQIEFLNMQANEVLAMWEDILRVIQEDESEPTACRNSLIVQ